jgi:hypothetical protein
MRETRRHSLELQDYAKLLMNWIDEVRMIKSKYIDAIAPRDLTDFQTPLQGPDVSIIECQTLVPWIQQLQRRIEIEQTYLQGISGGDSEVTGGSSTTTMNNGHPGAGVVDKRNRSTSGTDSPLEEGEIRENSLLSRSETQMGKYLEVSDGCDLTSPNLS